jgi:hypothetical protein
MKYTSGYENMSIIFPVGKGEAFFACQRFAQKIIVPTHGPLSRRLYDKQLNQINAAADDRIAPRLDATDPPRRF